MKIEITKRGQLWLWHERDVDFHCGILSNRDIVSNFVAVERLCGYRFSVLPPKRHSRSRVGSPYSISCRIREVGTAETSSCLAAPQACNDGGNAVRGGWGP